MTYAKKTTVVAAPKKGKKAGKKAKPKSKDAFVAAFSKKNPKDY